MKINEYLEGAISLNMKLVAHTVYWALINQLVSGDDDVTKMFNIPLDEAEINRLTEQNVLGVEKIKLFVIQTQKKDLYAFYFAEDALTASQLHQSLFGEKTTSISNGKRLWLNTMHFVKQGYEMTFLDYRDHLIQFPAYIGHAYARQNVCYYLVPGGITA